MKTKQSAKPSKAQRRKAARTLRAGVRVQRIVSAHLTPGQRKLMKKHGTPAEMAAAIYAAVPGWISMTEAAIAVAKYDREWADAR